MIHIDAVSHQFAQLPVLQNISLNIEKGEFVVILGPSGCGKSTLLSLAAGFMPPTTGSITVDNQKPVPESKKFGFVFQDYSLFPWKTVLGNIKAGLLGLSKEEQNIIALDLIEKIDLTEFTHQYPHKLSGGMKQRVGLARALAYDPEILLMDEPFGALDAQTRKKMQQELRKILDVFNKTVIFITHSVIEAVYLADRVIVLSNRPSQIIYEEKIEIEGERHYTGDAFLYYRERILHYLNKETGVKE